MIYSSLDFTQMSKHFIHSTQEHYVTALGTPTCKDVTLASSLSIVFRVKEMEQLLLSH